MQPDNTPGKISVLTGSELSKFFADELRCLYKSEKELLVPVNTMQQSAHMEELKDLFGEYSRLIHRQTIRLENIFNFLSIKPDGNAPAAMEGLIREINRTIEKTQEGSTTRDAAMIIALQKAAHYKIAAYGSLEQLANSLGLEEVTTILRQSLQDEKISDQLFSDIAEKRINWLAETE